MNTDTLCPPSTLYNDRITQAKITPDRAQTEALQALDDLWYCLNHPTPVPMKKLGVYLWGSVGRGKTMLMDLFYQSLPNGLAKRQHFHHFMVDLHRELNTTFGVTNPLDRIAARMAKDVRVICFDEFFVADIADAMLLGNLVQALFREGCCLVATSNIAVCDLFQTQLQKERFAPTILTLEQHLECVHLTGKVDHRFRLPLDQAVYFTHAKALQRAVSRLGLNEESEMNTLIVNHRTLPVLARNEVCLWCDFHDLCESHRSAHDYIALAQQFDCLIVSNIPELSSTPYEHIKARGTEDGAIGSGTTGEREVVQGLNDDAVRRFISLVDECYDQRMKMLFQAAVPLDKLYTNGILVFEFQRTYSRITEMQTKGYLEASF